MPTKIGRIALCHALTRRGGIRSEFTITKIGEQHFYVVSAGAAERYDSDYLQQTLPQPTAACALAQYHHEPRLLRASPGRGRAMCWPNSPTCRSTMPHFPGSPGRCAEVGLATDVYLLRVNFVGALGWELHFPIEYAHHLFDALFAAGAEFGIGMAGMRAMESLRLEKSYRMWGSDLTPDYTPYEAGLDRFVRLSKGPFIGKEALEKQLKQGVPHRFVTFEVHGVTDADPLGNEPLFDLKGKLVGRATAGYYGHALQQEPGIGLCQAATSRAVGTDIEIEILGERKRATVLVDSPYDPENKELRA